MMKRLSNINKKSYRVTYAWDRSNVETEIVAVESDGDFMEDYEKVVSFIKKKLPDSKRLCALSILQQEDPL